MGFLKPIAYRARLPMEVDFSCSVKCGCLFFILFFWRCITDIIEYEKYLSKQNTRNVFKPHLPVNNTLSFSGQSMSYRVAVSTNMVEAPTLK